MGVVSTSAGPGRAGTRSASTRSASIVLPTRAMLIAGGIAALAAAASGLAVLVLVTLVGWITAPHVGVGSGLSGVLRSAGLLWLVAHHVQVNVRGVGRIGLLPLGLVLLPGALLERAGRWLTHEGHVRRLRHVWHAALAIAFPYALFTAAVAVGSRTPAAAPSLWQAVVVGFLIALVAGGVGAARGLAPWRKLAGLMSPRPRSIVLGMVASLAMVTAAGALLSAASLVIHLNAYKSAVNGLNPGMFGSVLLLLAGLSYLPNSVIWAVAYMLGPGFAFGAGTAVSPDGSALGPIPLFPMLAGLPVGQGAAFPMWLGFFVLVTPYLAGVLAGAMTVRIAPTPYWEAAPLWGLLTGSLTSAVIGVLAKFSGGPLGAGRLGSVGPVAAEVGIVAVLEIGVTAAVTAGLVNWLIVRHHMKRLARAAQAEAGHADGSPMGVDGTAPGNTAPGNTAVGNTAVGNPAVSGAVAGAVRTSGPLAAVIDETDDAGGHRIYIDPWATERETGEAGEDPPG
jgi:hypothetical protein